MTLVDMCPGARKTELVRMVRDWSYGNRSNDWDNYTREELNRLFRSNALIGKFPIVRIWNKETRAYDFEVYDLEEPRHVKAMMDQERKYTRTITRNTRCLRNLRSVVL